MRWVILGVCLGLAPGCEGELDSHDPGMTIAREDAPPAVPMLRIIADGDDVRLRSGPGSGYDTVARIPNGCLVESTGPPDFGWLPIRWRQDEGWIYGGYVEHADPGEADCQ
jgi:hypothetical protein